MLELHAPEWSKLTGGYRLPYDASPLLRNLHASSKCPPEIWEEIWNELHHQGDVGSASYAVMPWLLKIYQEKDWIDFQLPGYAFAVEQPRLNPANPKVPDWLAAEYDAAIIGILTYCLSKKSECNEPSFQKAVVLLAAAFIGATEIAELLDFVSTGDEQRALELYDAGAV